MTQPTSLGDAGPPLNAAARPSLPRGVRLREDPARGWVLLGPERVITLDEIAAAVLREVDGVRTFGEIVDRLAARFDGPRETIAAEAGALLRALADRRLVDL